MGLITFSPLQPISNLDLPGLSGLSASLFPILQNLLLCFDFVSELEWHFLAHVGFFFFFLRATFCIRLIF